MNQNLTRLAVVLATVGCSSAAFQSGNDPEVDAAGGTGGSPVGTGGTAGSVAGAAGAESGVTAGYAGQVGDAAPDVRPAGSALRFDGDDDRVDLPADEGGADEAAFTVELWFRTTTPNGVLFEVHGSSGGADRSLYVRDGRLCFYVNGPPSEACGVAHVADGKWHHAAGVLGNGGQRLYIDGTSGAALPAITSSLFDSDEGFRLGYGRVGAFGAFEYFTGDLDEVRVWRAVRAPAAVSDIDPSTSGLQGYWKLDGDPGDETAAGNDGQLVGFDPGGSPWIVP